MVTAGVQPSPGPGGGGGVLAVRRAAGGAVQPAPRHGGRHGPGAAGGRGQRAGGLQTGEPRQPPPRPLDGARVRRGGGAGRGHHARGRQSRALPRHPRHRAKLLALPGQAVPGQEGVAVELRAQPRLHPRPGGRAPGPLLPAAAGAAAEPRQPRHAPHQRARRGRGGRRGGARHAAVPRRGQLRPCLHRGRQLVRGHADPRPRPGAAGDGGAAAPGAARCPLHRPGATTAIIVSIIPLSALTIPPLHCSGDPGAARGPGLAGAGGGERRGGEPAAGARPAADRGGVELS